jgi:hypothetical protein
VNPTEIVSKLRSNGGQLATVAADCIEQLLEQVPAKPRCGIDPRHKAIVLLFQSRLNKPQRDPKEIRVFNGIKDQVTTEDLKNLKRFYRQPEPKHYHKILSRRKNAPITLMRSWIDQCELAAEWNRKNPPPPDPTATKFPEPANWQPHAPGALGERSWSHICQQYPDIAENLHNQLKK